MTSKICIRCLELNHEQVPSLYECTVEQKITKRIRDVSLCEKCLKYMKKMNLLVKIYEEYYEDGYE